jgi:type VI protein secretion system component Hcp
MIPTVEQQEVNMTDYVETPADRKAASVTSRELNEAELSTVAGGSAGKVTFNLFSITRNVDKASPVLFL